MTPMTLAQIHDFVHGLVADLPNAHEVSAEIADRWVSDARAARALGYDTAQERLAPVRHTGQPRTPAWGQYVERIRAHRLQHRGTLAEAIRAVQAEDWDEAHRQQAARTVNTAFATAAGILRRAGRRR